MDMLYYIQSTLNIIYIQFLSLLLCFAVHDNIPESTKLVRQLTENKWNYAKNLLERSGDDKVWVATQYSKTREKLKEEYKEYVKRNAGKRFLLEDEYIKKFGQDTHFYLDREGNRVVSYTKLF